MEKLSKGNETSHGKGTETSSNTDEKNMYIGSVRIHNVW
jgi:hypothetical protein